MKGRFRVILILMSVSLFGIILVQGLWISHAKRSEEARFDKAVYEAMNFGLQHLERNEMIYFLDSKMDLPAPPVFPDWSSDSNVHHKRVHAKPVQYKFRKAGESGRNKVIVLSKDSADLTIIHEFDTENEFLEEEDEFVVDILEDEYFAEGFELEVLLDEYGDSHIEIEHEHLDSLYKSIEERQIIVEKRMEKFNKGMKQWAFEYSFDNRRLNETFLHQSLDTLLSQSLNNKGINLAFNYQVVKVKGDTTEIIKSNIEYDEVLPQKYKTELYPDDLFRKSLFLVIDFPGRTKHIYQAVALLISGSGLFTLIILITFGFTLYYIQKQKKISEVKSDFINNMTHEFKTPLATIGLATDALGSPKVFGIKEQTDYYLKIIRQENKRMNKQVEKVLQMALIENHDLQLDFHTADLHNIIQGAIAVVELPINEKKGKIISALRANCSILPVDEIHFSNVLNNIFDNAMKYTENPPEILVETFNKSNKLIIRISDNGLGMSKEVQQHVFDKFYRKPTGNIHNVKGFGLGLSYGRAIVSAHGGEISVSSEPGNGSVFTLSFDC